MVEDSEQAESEDKSYFSQTKASIFCAQFHTLFEILEPNELDIEEQKD